MCTFFFSITFLLLKYPGLCIVDGRMMNWKGFESCVGLIEVLSHYLPGGTVETHEKLVRMESACYVESWNTTVLGVRLHVCYNRYSVIYVTLNYMFNGVGGKKFLYQG
jgi:hypothetical protein